MRRRKKTADTSVTFATSIRLPGDLAEFVRRRATDTRRSLSYVMVEVLRQWQAYEEKVPPGQRKKRVADEQFAEQEKA